MDAKKRILFVDDDRQVLDGLRRMLHGMRNQWKMEFVTKASDGLKVMREQPYDIVVSDLRMPSMDGVRFLEKVRKKYPQTIRLMLSGYSDQPMRSRAARCVHQLISKPYDAEKLSNLISRSLVLHSRIKSQRAAEVVGDLCSLPVMPKTYQLVIEELHRPNCSARQVGNLISQDVGLSTKILQLSNSAFYGANIRIVDPVRAVVHLGTNAIEALILTEGVFSMFSREHAKRFHIDGLQEHFVRVGMLTRAICQSQGMDDEQLQMATMAGILHDTGRLIMIVKFPDAYADAIERSRREQVSLMHLEQEIVGVPHTDLGGYLLDLWGLPNIIIEAATYHHEPEKFEGHDSCINTMLYAADCIDHEFCCSPGDGCYEPIRIEYFEEKGLMEMYQRWRRHCVPAEFGEWIHVA